MKYALSLLGKCGADLRLPLVAPSSATQERIRAAIAARPVAASTMDASGRPIPPELEALCLKALALHQPVAIDLRRITAIILINTDLERIADHATNIAEDVIYLTTGSIIRHQPQGS